MLTSTSSPASTAVAAPTSTSAGGAPYSVTDIGASSTAGFKISDIGAVPTHGHLSADTSVAAANNLHQAAS